MAKFEIFNSSNNQFYYSFKANNNEKVLSSEGYTTKASCQNAIASVKSNAPYESRYRKLTASNGQFYFTLTAANGETIGTSEMYYTTQGRDNGIDVVKREAPTATVVDLTTQKVY